MALQRQPTFYLTHGGGPMPLLGAQPTISDFIKSAASLLPRRPRAILCVTAHWETNGHFAVSTAAKPPMLYDYYGFPAASYQIKYPAPGDPLLASKVMDLIRKAGLPVAADNKRGFDHGTFVPLKLMFPDADVPVVQMSVMSSLDPALHLALGRALEPLRDDNVLIVASGSSFHDLGRLVQAFQSGRVDSPGLQKAVAFDAFLRRACCESSPEERAALLERWEEAPGARLSHPREEHLIPLHVAAGAAGLDPGQQVMLDDTAKYPCSSFMFNAAQGQSAAA